MSNKTARMIWKDNELNLHGILGSGYEFDLSSNADPLGGSPMEFLLAAVAGCTAMDVISILQKKREPITGFEVEIRGTRAQEHPKVYTAVTLLYLIRGEGVNPQSVERAIELSQTKYCSASAMFQQAGVEFHTTYRIEA
jgi:putative redox protein